MSTNVSQLLRRQLLALTTGGLLLAEILASAQEQGFGLLLVTFALPVLIPLPPGVGAIPGLLIMGWAVQRLFGYDSPWLPRRLTNRTLSPHTMDLLSSRAIPVLERMERLFPQSTTSRPPREWEYRLACVVVVLMGFLILLPTPFLNTIPALIILATGLAFVNQHRILLWSAIVLGVAIFGLLFTTVVLGGERLLDEFMDEAELPNDLPTAP